MKKKTLINLSLCLAASAVITASCCVCFIGSKPSGGIGSAISYSDILGPVSDMKARIAMPKSHFIGGFPSDGGTAYAVSVSSGTLSSEISEISISKTVETDFSYELTVTADSPAAAASIYSNASLLSLYITFGDASVRSDLDEKARNHYKINHYSETANRVDMADCLSIQTSLYYVVFYNFNKNDLSNSMALAVTVAACRSVYLCKYDSSIASTKGYVDATEVIGVSSPKNLIFEPTPTILKISGSPVSSSSESSSSSSSESSASSSSQSESWKCSVIGMRKRQAFDDFFEKGVFAE